MKRRVLAVAAAAATAVAVLPAAPAFAAASATAALTGPTAVYPGTDRTFTLSVTNNGMAVLGETINAIRVNFPVNEAGITLGSGAGSAAGFTEAKATNLGGTQFITYKGGSLRPGSSVSITFPATVAAPLAKDLLGDFRVQVSSDGFATSSTAPGNLVAKVQVLEVLGLKPVAPTSADGGKGVTDRTGTVGQTVQYATDVKNYSRSPLSVTTTLTSNGGGDQPGSASASIPAGGTGTATAPVKLGDLGGARTITAVASTATATSPAKTDTFSAQSLATVAPSTLDGTRVKSGAGSARDFTVTLSKTGAQAVDAFSSSLTFGGNTCGLVSAPTFPAGSSSQQVTYRCTSISGADGAYPATVSYSLTDDNLASYGRDALAVGTITIDNVAPVIDLVVGLPKDLDGDQQTATKNGDTITVSGNIANAGDLAANTVRVVLTPDSGSAVVVDAPVSGSGETRTFSGTAKPTWAANATRFSAAAQASDTAGNDGGGVAPGTTVIDNVVPALTNPGRVVDPSTIEVTFADATGIKGGCTASFWQVDGTPGRVSEVRTADGKACDSTTSGTRLLVLSSPLGVDQTPRVTYDPTGGRVISNRRPAKDGAGNDALTKTIDTVTNLVPAAPSIVSLERRDGAAGAGFEPAYLDAGETAYYTNVGGADALRLTVAGVKQNYTVQVLKGTALVAERKFTAAPALGASSYNGDVLVPLRTTDGTDAFSVRLVSTQGNPGDGTPFKVVLDTVRPALGAATISGSTVKQAFTDKLVLGSDLADNWFVSETVATESGTATRTVNVDSVTADGPASRTMQVTLSDPSKFVRLDYYAQQGVRYEDRAGNPLADTLSAG